MMTDPINAIVRDMDDPRHPCLLGVSCDAADANGYCGDSLESDFVVHLTDPRAIRLGYILDYAARKGWTVVDRANPGAAKTYCPVHKHLAAPVVIPGNAELIGTQFPGQMPQATWAELMAWTLANGFDPDRSPATRDIVIGATLDRWETPDGDDFGNGPTRGGGAVLAEGEEWSTDLPGQELIARPVRSVSTPVTVPLPQHLRTAIEKAAAGLDLPGNMRTPIEWCAQYAVAVTDRTGWDDSRSWHDPIREDEFVTRFKASVGHTVPLTDEQANIQLLFGVLSGSIPLADDSEAKA